MRNIIAAVVFLLIFILGFGIIKNGSDTRKWKGRGRYTVFEVGNQIKVKSIDPKTKLGIRLELPEETLIKTLDERGDWKAPALSKLGEKYGHKWLGNSLADFLGITYTLVEDEMGWWDKLTWWNLNREVKWTEVDLKGKNWLAETEAVDGERILGLGIGWSRKFGDLFYSQELAKSDLEVKVVNTTKIPGLANKIANRIESSGVRVVEAVASEENTGRGCEIESEKKYEKNSLVLWLSDNFSCKWQEKNIGEIVNVYLGEGFEK